MHTLNLAQNLFSVSQIVDHGCVVSFDPTSCFVQDRHTGILIGQDHRREELYIMDHIHLPFHPRANVSCSTHIPPSPFIGDFWRRCLGHLSIDLRVLVNKGTSHSFSFSNISPCIGCNLAKQSTRPFVLVNLTLVLN